MALKKDFGSGYGSTVRAYRDDPNHREFSDDSPGGYGVFEELSEKISNNISKINSGANAIDRAMKLIGGQKDSVQIRDKIHDTSQGTVRVVSDTSKLFKQLATGRRLDRQQKFKLDRLKNDFQDSCQRFTGLQKIAAEKVKTSVRLGSDNPLKPSAAWSDENYVADEAHLIEQDRRRGELQAQEQVIEDDLALIHDREERIRQLESDVLDVNQIFQDLGFMIKEQGEVLDTIEANVESTASNVETGAGQLVKAAQYQRKARKKMCIILVIFLIVAAVLAIILATTLS